MKSDGSVIIDTRMNTSGFDKGMHKSYLNLRKEIDRVEKQLDRLIEKEIKFRDTGGNTESRAFLGMEYDIESLRNKLAELKAEEANLLQNVSFKEISSETERLKEAFENLGKKIDSSRKKLLKFVGNGILNGFKKIGSHIKKFASNMINFDKNTKKANYSMLKMLSTSVLFSTVFRAIRAVTNGFKDGMNNIVQYSYKANVAMSALKSSLTQLKNSFATAFSPILSVVGPILVSFINLISRAVTVVSALFSALSGNSTYTKAVALQEDYAASLKDTSKNADSAKKSLNNYLSGLDELNVNSQESSNDSADISILPENMFKEEEIPIPVNVLAERIKEIFDTIKKLFSENDWNGLGIYISDLLNKGLEHLYNVLNWENVKVRLIPFIEGFTEFFDYFVIGFDWKLLGQTIGTGINTIINSLNLLVEGINWKLLGSSIGEGLNGLFSEVNWENLGNLIGNGFMIAWDLFRGFVYKIDYSEIGLSIADGINGFLETIDLGEMVDSLSQFAIGFLETLTTTIQNTDFELVGQQISNALKAIDWLGIAKGLWDAGTALIGGILDAFGELPAPVQLVIDLFAGFLTASGIKGIISFITGNVLPVIGQVIGFISGAGGIIGLIQEVSALLGPGGIFALAIGAAVTVLLLLIQNWDEITATMTAFDEFLQNVFSIDWTESFGALGEVFNAFSFILSDLWNNGIKKTFTGIIDFITGIFTGNWKKAWSGIKDIFSGIFSSIKTIAFSNFNIIIGAVNGLINAIEQGLNGIINLINGLSFDIPEWVPVFGGKKFSLNIPNITVPRIPYLATGAVIPPNAPFLAILGDQRHGNNIEAPEDLIRQIVREEAGLNAEVISLLAEIVRNTRETADKDFGVSIDSRELVSAYDERKARNGYAF